MGETGEIGRTEYPNQVFTGRISNVARGLDPTLRTAKVRIEVSNPGIMRIGMFVTATFHGQKKETRAAVPATAILHLHDRDWVYLPIGGNKFRRTEVTAGNSLPDKIQEIISGIRPGKERVSKALALQTTV